MRITALRCVYVLAASLTVAVATAQQAPVPRLVSQEEIEQGLPVDGSRWLTFGGDYSNQRHSPLTQITPANVDRLVPQWTFQTGVVEKFETTPLLRDNVLYVTGPPQHGLGARCALGSAVLGISPRAAPRISPLAAVSSIVVLQCSATSSTWSRSMRICSRSNSATGRIVWDATLADYSMGYAATIAPIAANGNIIVGVAGGEFGIRGFIDAYDAETGERAWRFYTIPGPGEPGNETWAGDSWQTGGASVWVTGAFDPDLNLLYYGIGNPGPDYHSESRLGDNLYSDSIVALDADTGELRWHYQFTPHDVHDWDATEVPILADIEIEGELREVVMFANRNGFYYTIDRATGELLVAEPFVRTTWAEEVGVDGRPILLPGHTPTEDGEITCPDLTGGTNFWPPSFDPETGLFYVNAA